ncbi:LysR family transcriptional regulator [Paraburkholderia acidicola]|uniref:LysR family transcriptional regulator n=1 Tax=Paraburkholderia acidicola TaxID=1912599 RepID=A0A2A4ETS7_9BURK|nr:LysR family transcriptional regulator [Paraburkholderia acidicola]PCE25023.1 LysR family transcriptional regulator [Paraburkholderia acidicola]
MDSLQSMRLFTRVVELGSFSAAAREEDMSQPTMSKIIAALERSLGVRLLERTTTSLTPTEEGKRFYERSKRVIEEYVDAVADAQGRTQRLAGTLIVNAPVGLGELHLNGLFLEFLAQYPEIEIELILNDRVVDLVEEGVDVAIRLGSVLPPNVVARQIASSPRVLVASPDYIERNPKVRRPEDLVKHEYLRFAGVSFGAQMEFSRAAEKVVVEVGGRYRVNSSLALRQCFLAGAGLGTAGAWLVQDLIDTGALVRLLPKWQMASQPVHLVYPSRRYQPLRTRTLLQFLAARLPLLPGLYGPAA